jgi:hypothetical protein
MLILKRLCLAMLTVAGVSAPLLAANKEAPSQAQAMQQAANQHHMERRSYQYPRELGSAAEMYIEQRNTGLPDIDGQKRDPLHPDVDDDQDVEYMFEESEVW